MLQIPIMSGLMILNDFLGYHRRENDNFLSPEIHEEKPVYVTPEKMRSNKF